jgi:hypothetical protein
VSDVKAKLAAAKCAAAPHGWGPHDQGGYEIHAWFRNCDGDSSGVAENCAEELCARTWNDDGVVIGPGYDLVPLPAPTTEPERLTDDRLANLVWRYGKEHEEGIAAIELQESRKTISEQAAALAAKEGEAERQAKETIERLTRERDAAIDLARRMRSFVELTGTNGTSPIIDDAQSFGIACRDWDRAHGERTAAAPFDRCPEPLPTCEPLPAPDFRKFPFDREGMYYRTRLGAIFCQQIDTASTWRRRDGVLMVRLDAGWVSVDDLRKWQRSADGINWEACPNE